MFEFRVKLGAKINNNCRLWCASMRAQAQEIVLKCT